ncbi:MAG: helix-hairpin-helix domain-containing protein [Syntrophobacterales bacterium]|jgi:DNA uptake protein ComE-like DNA-binding protein|nr:helix-hairpin-helix domain-containing protein [Syntrophobacterales bacterium]
MKDRVLWGSIVFIFLIVCSKGFLSLKQMERTVPWAEKKGGTAAVEWVANGEKQGIFYLSSQETVTSFLARFFPQGEIKETIPIEDGMSIHTGPGFRVTLGEMEPPAKLALGILLNIHSLTPPQLMLIPGIGPKTADKIHLFLQQEGCIRDLNELVMISGIKEKRVATMRQYLMVKKGECGKVFSEETSRQIIVAKKMTKAKKITPDRPMNINGLTTAQLILVPGIGQKTADKIHTFIKERGCIQDIEELSAISGIKERKIENMRKYLYVKSESCHRRGGNEAVDL